MTAAPRPDRLDAARQGVLDRMERADRHVRNAILPPAPPSWGCSPSRSPCSTGRAGSSG
jgi:hypothetical protein